MSPQSDDFASGNQITVVNGTAEVNLDPAGAYDNTYTAHYYVQVTLSSPGFDPYVRLTVALETNDGSGWVERATFIYERVIAGTSTWSHEQKAIVVAGLGLNDDIRLRAKSFIKHDAIGSFAIRGGDAGGSNPETYNGVTYATSADPVVDVAPYNYATQDYTRCAVACFAAVHQQSTTPYVSLDAPRFVTLVYNSDRFNPRPFVHVNVSPAVAFPETPTEYRLEVKVNGAFVTFLNGEQTLRFAYPGAVTARIGGQFDAASYATGVYPMNILVTAVYPIAGVSTKDIATKFVVVNETNSAIGAGWTLAGIERLYLQSDSSALITEGDGNAVYFARVGGAYLSPAGEFSQLVTGTPGGGGGGWTRRYPDSTKIVFNPDGRMTEVRDRFNNISTVVYDGFYRISQIKDPLNLGITLTYDVGNRLDYITDQMGRVTQVTVDGSNRLTMIQDPDLIGTMFGYDGSNRLSTITDRRGFTTTLGYDTPSGKLATITAPAISYVGTNGADSTGSPVTVFSAWQKVGVPYTSTATTAATAPLADTVYARVTDPGGHVTRFTVNPWGSPQETRDALGFITTVTYDGLGLVRRVVYPTGAKDTLAYNTSGLLIFTRAAGRDSATNIRYTAWAQPDSIWGYQQPSVRRFIGANGRVDSTRVAGGTADSAKTRFTYETRGRVEQVTDPQGHLAGRTWYAGTNGNRSRDSLPGGRVTTYTYDTYGRPTSVVPPGVAASVTTYDVVNRVLKDSIAGLAPTVYTYDALYLQSVTDPKGQVYGFTYNALGWTTARTDPASHADSLRYDREGLLRRWKNRRGQAIDYGYDGGHRLTSKSGTNTDATSWTYSADSRTVTASSPWAVDTQFLSTVGRLDSVRTTLASQTFIQRFRYPTAGLLDSVEIAGGGIPFVARKYLWNTQRGTLSTIRLGGGGNTALGTNKDLQLTGTTLPGGDLVSRAYTSVHDEAQISTSAAYAQTVSRYVSFDAANRIVRQIYGDGVSGHAFFYDALGRLVADSQIAYQDPSNPCTGDPPPIIDENGNTCTYSGTWVTIPSGSASFTYDGVGNRLDQGGDFATANRIRQFAGCSYVTDSLSDGNVLSRTCGTETVRFHWTAESRLAALKVVGGDSLDFRYDASGRLVRKDVNAVPQASFLWQGDKLLAELTGTATAKVAEYSYYPGLDNPHAVITGTTPHFAHVDGIGNVIALTDSAQNVKRDYDYDAWGALRGGTDFKPFANADRARFKGALWLGPQVDVYYMRARWYEPKTGRFLSEDPVGLAGGLNPYVYAADDPVNGSDPTGLCVWMLIEERSVTTVEYPSGRVEVTYGPWRVVGVECVGGGGGGGSFGGGLGGGWGGGQQPQARPVAYTPLAQCPAFNQQLLSILNSELRVGTRESLERGGHYQFDANRQVTAPMTGTNRQPGRVTIPFQRGSAGIWHIHIPGFLQGPSSWDSTLARAYNQPFVTRSTDSLFITYPDGRSVGCAR